MRHSAILSCKSHALCPSVKPFTTQRTKCRRSRRAAYQSPQAIFNIFKPKGAPKEVIQEKKQELIELISSLNRGVSADSVDQEQVEELVQGLEKINPTKSPLKSPLINGQWELIYTTSAGIVGTKKPPYLRPQGPIYQLIDAENLKASNRETWPFFNQVDAELTPASASEVSVQFKKFKIFGLIPVTAPDSAKGSLDTTFLDEEMRISRGDRGNLFVLLMDDASKRP